MFSPNQMKTAKITVYGNSVLYGKSALSMKWIIH